MVRASRNTRAVTGQPTKPAASRAAAIQSAFTGLLSGTGSMGVVQEHCCCRPGRPFFLPAGPKDGAAHRLLRDSQFTGHLFLAAVPASSALLARSRSTTRHWASVRCCTRRPIRRRTASAFAAASWLHGLRYSRSAFRRSPAVAPMCAGRLFREFRDAPLTLSRASHYRQRNMAGRALGGFHCRAGRHEAASGSLRAGSPPGSRCTSPMPIPTYQCPLRRACKAMSTTSGGVATTPWSSSPTERSKWAPVRLRSSAINGDAVNVRGAAALVDGQNVHTQP